MNFQNPFPGLRPFSPKERHLFMGREVPFQQVTAQTRLFPLTLMVARSGVGKSSFLTCRLVPALREIGDVTYLNEWGATPPTDLVHHHLDLLSRSPRHLDEKPLLVLDQFEDIFKVPFEREPLWEKLAEAVNVDEPPVHVLVSMREEWMGAWAEAEEYLPGALGTIVRLLPLGDSEIRDAIVRPTKIQGDISIADDLVDVIMKDLRQPYIYGTAGEYIEAGILQVVCHRLWSEARARNVAVMDCELYTSLGRADSIARQFVWMELGRASTDASPFSASDRVLWFGMTRHFVVSPGVKSIMTIDALARAMRMDDLGLAGPATLRSTSGATGEEYSGHAPRKARPTTKKIHFVADRGSQKRC